MSELLIQSDERSGNDISLRLVGTCPFAAKTPPGKEYRDVVAQAAVLAENDGWESILVYTDHRQIDPWLTAQLILQSTRRLCPLVAVQPIYMHPFTLAKMIASLVYLYRRRIFLNMVAGGFPRDLETMCDDTPHDRRYARLVEYATIVHTLLKGPGATSFDGDFYRVKGLQIVPCLPPELLPVFMMSGSSDSGMRAARRLGARAIQYLRPAYEYEGKPFDPQLHHGTRLGIIVRDTAEEAWDEARRRYPENTAGAAIRKYAVSISDSVWVKELGREIRLPEKHPYWLGPYHNAQAACPFLVGSREDVVQEIVRYIRLGLRTFLLEQPTDAEDSRRITQVFRLARQRASLRSEAAWTTAC